MKEALSSELLEIGELPRCFGVQRVAERRELQDSLEAMQAFFVPAEHGHGFCQVQLNFRVVGIKARGDFQLVNGFLEQAGEAVGQAEFEVSFGEVRLLLNNVVQQRNGLIVFAVDALLFALSQYGFDR